jgi:hypothetical protein
VKPEQDVSQKRALIMAALFCGSACSAPVADGTGPSATIKRSETTGAQLIVVESDTLVDGRRPTMTLVCKPGELAALQLDLVRAPATPPPPRGIFAQMEVAGSNQITIELVWMTGSTWAPLLPQPGQATSDSEGRDNQRRLLPILYAFARERALRLTPPAEYGPGYDLVWSPETLGPHLRAAQACAAVETPR